MNTTKRKAIILGLVILNIGILGGVLLPAFSPSQRSSKHIPLPREDQVLRARLSLAGKLTPVAMMVGLAVIAVGVAMKKKTDETEDRCHNEPSAADG